MPRTSSAARQHPRGAIASIALTYLSLACAAIGVTGSCVLYLLYFAIFRDMTTTAVSVAFIATPAVAGFVLASLSLAIADMLEVSFRMLDESRQQTLYLQTIVGRKKQTGK